MTPKEAAAAVRQLTHDMRVLSTVFDSFADRLELLTAILEPREVPTLTTKRARNERIHELASQGHSAAEIARKVGLSRAGVSYVLHPRQKRKPNGSADRQNGRLRRIG